MTAFQHYEIHCDAPDCDATYNSWKSNPWVWALTFKRVAA